jgi:hypothetical protein
MSAKKHATATIATRAAARTTLLPVNVFDLMLVSPVSLMVPDAQNEGLILDLC